MVGIHACAKESDFKHDFIKIPRLNPKIIAQEERALSATTKVKVVKVDSRTGSRKIVEEDVAVEAPIHVYVNGELVITLFATPVQLKELAIGYLLDEGMVRTPSQVKRVRIKETAVKVEAEPPLKTRFNAARTMKIITTACGSSRGFLKLLDRMDRPTVKSSYRLKAEDISMMMQELNSLSETFRLTGGMHSAALFADGNLVAFSEDVGRHNAVDKVIGAAALKQVNFARCVLATSGRQPADMVLKAARMGIPISVSMCGPIDSGILAAEKTGLTLICFARGQRMNVYTFPERIQ